MKYVIRNGEYLETNRILFGDIEVSRKPHPKDQWINKEWFLDADLYFSELDKSEALKFLQNTDWKIMRHQEQKDLGITTSLSDNEYLELIKERQNRRNILNDITN